MRWQQPHSLALPELGLLTQPLSTDEGEKVNILIYMNIFMKKKSQFSGKQEVIMYINTRFGPDQTPKICGCRCHMLHDVPRCIPVLSSSCGQGRRILQVWTCTGTLPGHLTPVDTQGQPEALKRAQGWNIVPCQGDMDSNRSGCKWPFHFLGGFVFPLSSSRSKEHTPNCSGSVIKAVTPLY